MDKRSEPGRDAKGGGGGKRKYEPPQILSQEVFETTALACFKIFGQSSKCNSGGGKS